MELTVCDLQGKLVGRIALDPAVWDDRINFALLSQTIAMYRSNVRAGTASTKTRGDVSGGGKKPWKQKHTGRARAGSNRSPLWRHGGSTFGPRPRDMSYRLPQAIRRRALIESLKGKLHDAELVVVEGLAADTPKTKPFAGLADAFQVARSSIIVLDGPNEALVKSLRNLPRFGLRDAANLNAFDVVNAHKVLLTKPAFERLEQRIKADASGH